MLLALLGFQGISTMINWQLFEYGMLKASAGMMTLPNPGH
jgi:hypothetical protein